MQDFQRLEEIFSDARKRMALNGNPDQWKDNRPSAELIKRDIQEGHSYVIEENDRIVATFACIPGIEKTYLEIDGKWLDDEEYVTIHRIASDGSVKGVFKAALECAKSFKKDVRIDTHKDNKPMLHLMEKYGFVYCGIIIVDDCSQRLAFQKKI